MGGSTAILQKQGDKIAMIEGFFSRKRLSK